MPLSFKASYCFSFLTLGRLLGMCGGFPVETQMKPRYARTGARGRLEPAGRELPTSPSTAGASSRRSSRPVERARARRRFVMHHELPQRLDLDWYRKEAKRLVRAYRSGNVDTRARVAENLGPRDRFQLGDAQHLIA